MSLGHIANRRNFLKGATSLLALSGAPRLFAKSGIVRPALTAH